MSEKKGRMVRVQPGMQMVVAMVAWVTSGLRAGPGLLAASAEEAKRVASKNGMVLDMGVSIGGSL
jgi:hypothetical protein